MRIFVADKTDNKMKQLTQEQLEQVYREHPEWRVNIEAGKWYHYGSHLLCYVGSDEGDIRAYGFDDDMRWIDKYTLGWESSEEWNPAHHEEVEAALIAEAKRRYRNGDKVDRFDSRYLGESNSMVIQMVDDSFMESDGSIWVGSDNYFSICLFSDGKWATVITPASTLAEDIQVLKDKYPNYNWTIIAEEKQ